MSRTLSICTCLLALSSILLVGQPSIGARLSALRLDLTEQQLYSVSDGTRRLLQALPEPVDLYWFYSSQAARDLPDLRSYAQRVETLLREYERLGNGRIRLHIIDPGAFSAEEAQAQAYGLQAWSPGEGALPVYFGLAAVDAQHHQQSIAFFAQDQQSLLEYQISRLLHALSSPQRPALGLLSRLPLSGGFDPQSGNRRPTWAVFEDIRQAFDVRELDLELQKIPEDLKLLLLVHPRRLSQETLYAIDQFVLRGGRLLVFVDPYSEADPGDQYFGIPSKDKSSDLAPLLQAWGVHLNAGSTLGDGDYGQFVNLGPQADAVWQPTALSLPTAAINQHEVSTAGLQRINLSTAGVLEPLKGSLIRFNPLLHSSESSTLFKTARFDHLPDPKQLAREMKASGQRLTLAARLQGPARSAFPERAGAEEGGLVAADSINLIVVADTDLLRDSLWMERQEHYGQQQAVAWADNGAFVLNALDSLAGSEALIGLRSRGNYHRSFTRVEQMQRQARASVVQMQGALEKRLEETERQLAVLQDDATQADAGTPERQARSAAFAEERQAIVTEMRRVARDMTVQVDRLGLQLKLANIALVPALLSLFGLCLWGVRWWRRR